jgi:tRNA G46 methylase TrmB
MATDVEAYGHHMNDVISSRPGWVNTAGVGPFSERYGGRPTTHYERVAHDEGRGVWDLQFRFATPEV